MVFTAGKISFMDGSELCFEKIATRWISNEEIALDLNKDDLNLSKLVERLTTERDWNLTIGHRTVAISQAVLMKHIPEGDIVSLVLNVPKKPSPLGPVQVGEGLFKTR